MAPQRIVWQLFPAFLLVTVLAVGAATWFATRAARQFYVDQIEQNLQSQAQQLSHYIGPLIRAEDWEGIRVLVAREGEIGEMRITIILPDGRVVADSMGPADLMENHASRPEIRQALETGSGRSRRFSATIGRELYYFAFRESDGNEVIGVVRTALPTAIVNQAMRKITQRIAIVGLIIALCAAGISLWLARRISLPIEHMRQAAERFAQGNLLAKVHEPNSTELGDLADSLNVMARQLHERIQTITQQRNELEAILTSMLEGVLAVDRVGRIMNINQAGAEVLGVDAKKAVGKIFYEVVRNQAFQDFVDSTLSGDETTEAEIHLVTHQDLYLRLQGAGIYNADGRRTGAVIVLNDLTRLRRLENIRREFVANVSHELKTPITNIKGFVETLQDGGLEDPKEAQHFLAIIAAHTDRLNAIVEDLLSLSRLEESGGKGSLQRQSELLEPLLQDCVEAAASRAEAKGIELELSCDSSLTARINATLIEQAVNNLIDNALKYSNARGRVVISTEPQGREVVIRVRDFGTGIAAEHHERIFERFYVVNSARSRSLGGTGLGLALVKHIANAHSGRVTLESAPGKGATFSIYLPV